MVWTALFKKLLGEVQLSDKIEDEEVTPVIAEGVDEEPVESNRRLFQGKLGMFMAIYAGVYALFHMLALNGVSISEWTSIVVPLLPRFPMETWNFRIIHVAGALGLGFLLFSGRNFSSDGEKGSDALNLVSIALLSLIHI